MATGKKQTSATSRTLGARPKPSTRISSGAITGTGTACDPITSGRSARRTTPERCMATPSAAPTATAASSPTSTSWSVTARSGPSTSPSFHSEAAMSDGAGSSRASTIPARTSASQPASVARMMTPASISELLLHAAAALAARRPSAHPQRAEGALAQLDDRAVRPLPRTRERDLELGDHAARARREQHDAVREQDRLLDVVRDEQHRPRLARQRTCEPALELRAGERVEGAEGLVEAQHRPAREQRAQEGAALAHAARQGGGPRVLEPREPEGGEVTLRRRPRLRARRACDAQREAGVVERAQPRQQAVALGHEGSRGTLERARVGLQQTADELEHG